MNQSISGKYKPYRPGLAFKSLFSGKFAVVLFLTAFLLCRVSASAGDGIRIERLDIDCTVEARNGKAVKVKMTKTYTFAAPQSDCTAVLAEGYDNEAIEVAKASAPGAKPVYRAIEDDDIFYSGTRACFLPVPLKAGKSVKAVFELNYLKPQFFTNIILAERYEVGQVNVTVQLPDKMKTDVRIEGRNLPDGAEVVRSDDGRRYTLTLNDVAEYKSQRNAPDARLWMPCVSVNVCFDSMEGLYGYLHGMLDDEDATHPDVAALVDRITSGMTGDMEKIDAIAAWVRQNIRYIAIEHGDYGHRPDRAENVLHNRYGDCKGSANLIRAMLRAAGIDGRRVWIGTRGGVAEPWTRSYSISSGNHMIAAAVMADTTIFIDGTATYAPRGYIPFMDAGQQCIVEDGQSFRVDTVPDVAPWTDVVECSGVLNIDGQRLYGTDNVLFGGSRHIEIQTVLSKVTATRRDELMNVIMTGNRKSARTHVKEVKATGPNAAFTLVESDLEDAQGVRKADNGAKLYVSVRPLRHFPYTTLSDKSRTAPFRFGTPAYLRTAIELVVPEGYVPEQLPKRIDITGDWFEGFVEYTLTDRGNVLCTAQLATILTEGEASQTTAWNDAVRQVEKASSAPVILYKNDNQ